MVTQGQVGRSLDPDLIMRLLLLSAALIIGDFLVIPLVGSPFYFHEYRGDFVLFWQVSQFPMDALYGQLPFPYAPTGLMLMRAFGVLPFPVALVCWCLCGTAAMIAAARRIVDWKALFTGLFTAAVLGVIIGGQVSLFVGALIIAGLTQKRPWLAGVLLGCAAAIKPQSLLAAPFALLAARQYRTIVWAMITGAVLFGVTSVMWGPDTWLRWLFNLHTLPTYLIEHGLDRGDKGIYGLAVQLGGPGWLFIAGIPLGIACTWLVFRSESSGLDRYCAFAVSTILMSPYTLGYDLAGLTIAAVALLFDERRKPAVWAAAALIISSVLANFGVIILALVFCFDRWRRTKSPNVGVPFGSELEPIKSAP